MWLVGKKIEKLDISVKALGMKRGIPNPRMVARFNPQKDHKNLINAARVLCKNNKNIHFVLCGYGITNDNKQIAKWIQELG